MTYDSVIGLHSVWEVTKAKPEVSFLNKSLISRINISLNRAVKSREPGISPVIMNVAPAYLHRKMEEKMEPKEIPSRLISFLQCTCRIFPATWDLSDIPVLTYMYQGFESLHKKTLPHRAVL